MSAIVIEGGEKLRGEVKIQGSKNAALPIMAASLLIQGTTIIHGCPAIDDVKCMKRLLETLGCKVSFTDHTMVINASSILHTELTEESVKKVRASVLFLGALLGRKREACVEYPGGCSIGQRPIDYHLEGFRKMGVSILESDDRVSCSAAHMTGQKIQLDFPSVGATENLVLAACLAEGVTWIGNAAREPEVVELCSFLRAAGAMIEGDGSEHILIRGVHKLYSTEFTLCYDRIVFQTMGLLIAGARGKAALHLGDNKVPSDLQLFLRTGCKCRALEGTLILQQDERPKPIYFIKTRPYPGFPTDVQSPLMSVLSVASGDSIIEESIFENRLQTAYELQKLGASTEVIGNRCFIHGVSQLQGNDVRAKDLRGGMALVIAGLIANGCTRIENDMVIMRGYEKLVEQLTALEAKIHRQ